MARYKQYPPQAFGRRLTILMAENNITTPMLCERLGVDRKSVYAWEHGEVSPNIAILFRLCNILHTDADYLIGLSSKRIRKAAYLNDDFEQEVREMMMQEKLIRDRIGNKKIRSAV